MMWPPSSILELFTTTVVIRVCCIVDDEVRKQLSYILEHRKIILAYYAYIQTLLSFETWGGALQNHPLTCKNNCYSQIHLKSKT